MAKEKLKFKAKHTFVLYNKSLALASKNYLFRNNVFDKVFTVDSSDAKKYGITNNIKTIVDIDESKIYVLKEGEYVCQE